MSEPLKLDLGIFIVESASATAFAGYAGRVYPTERAAVADIALNELAKRWLSICGTGAPTFAQIVSYMESDLDLAEAALRLARFKTFL